MRVWMLIAWLGCGTSTPPPQPQPEETPRQDSVSAPGPHVSRELRTEKRLMPTDELRAPNSVEYQPPAQPIYTGGPIKLLQDLVSTPRGPDSIPYIALPVNATRGWKVNDQIAMGDERFVIACIQPANATAGGCKNPKTGHEFSRFEFDTVLLDHWPAKLQSAGTVVKK